MTTFPSNLRTFSKIPGLSPCRIVYRQRCGCMAPGSEVSLKWHQYFEDQSQNSWVPHACRVAFSSWGWGKEQDWLPFWRNCGFPPVALPPPSVTGAGVAACCNDLELHPSIIGSIIIRCRHTSEKDCITLYLRLVSIFTSLITGLSKLSLLFNAWKPPTSPIHRIYFWRIVFAGVFQFI